MDVPKKVAPCDGFGLVTFTGDFMVTKQLPGQEITKLLQSSWFQAFLV